LRPQTKYFCGLRLIRKVLAMFTPCADQESFAISPRFRKTIEDRIARLEKDADHDEAQLRVLVHADHLRRHKRLVAVQREEALRMRLFLERTGTRLPRPLIEI
jgi:hypothetical protein